MNRHMNTCQDDPRGKRAKPPGPFKVWILHLLYDLCYCALVVFLLPIFLYKLLTSKRSRAGFSQRLGWIPRRRDERPCIWIHGVSVGEVKTALSLLEALKQRLPGWQRVLSTTTLQGYQVASKEHPDILTFYYPLDFSLVTRRALHRIRPDAVVLMELELWPNFLLACDRLGIPVCLVNGRISARSYSGYRTARRFLPEPHQRIRFYGVQNEAYASRILNLGVQPERVHITGQMKYDAIQTDPAKVTELRREYREILGVGKDEWVLMGGSTHPSEEEGLLKALEVLQEKDENVRLVLAPRHMERLAEVEDLVKKAGFSPLRRTRASGNGTGSALGSVLLVDTVGELARLYAVADLVFVGGSLIPHGGQSMIEPASLGIAVVFGPHVWNFPDSVEALLAAGGAVQVENPGELIQALKRLHGDAAGRRALGQNALEVVSRLKGATKRNVDLIVQMVS